MWRALCVVKKGDDGRGLPDKTSGKAILNHSSDAPQIDPNLGEHRRTSANVGVQ